MKDFERTQRIFWRGFFSLIIIVVLIWGFFYFSITKGIEEHRSEKCELKGYVGEDIIIKGDTLMVLDYSTWDNTFTLDDDGRVIDVNLVKNLNSNQLPNIQTKQNNSKIN